MFVRWKKRKGERSSLAAYLVQSVRINGKPRQHVIAYLGVPRAHAGWWCGVEEKLHVLGMDEASREQVLQTLAQKATRPTAEQMKEADATRAAFREQYPPPPVVPQTPPPLTISGTTEAEEEGPLVITWKARPSFKRGKSTKYTASLARSASGAGAIRLSIITVLGSLDARDLQGERWGWKTFWYQVHCALCLSDVDRDSYYETMRLLSRWVKPPTQAELARLIQDQLKTDEWSARWHLDRALKASDKWLKKGKDLRTVRSRESHYLDQGNM